MRTCGRPIHAHPTRRLRSGDAPEATAPGSDGRSGSTANVDFDDLGLPSDNGAIVRYLTHRYKGVGEKTAESLVEAFGKDLFRTMQNDPDAIARTVPPKRAEQVLEAWRADFDRRTGRS